MRAAVGQRDLFGPQSEDLMRALTLWEPWASAVIFGGKVVENRKWAPPADAVGRRVWIHAGRHYDRERAAQVFALWPEGARLGLDTKRGGAIIGCARVADVITEARPGDRWFMGPVGWVLAEPVALERPVPVRGLQKLWPVPPAELERALAELRRAEPRRCG